MNTIINNLLGVNHAERINELIKVSSKIVILTAFFKETGLAIIHETIKNAILDGKEVLIVCGINYYQTEPKALLKLNELIGDKTNAKIMIYAENKMFHPKVFFFETNTESILIIGSANLTKGGLKDNVEISSETKINKDSEEYNMMKNIFEEIEINSNRVNELFISNYEIKYNIYHKQLERINKEIDMEIFALPTLNKENVKILKNYLNEYIVDLKEKADYQKRKDNYIKAKEILNILCNVPINNEKMFLDYYEKLVGKKKAGRLFHSDGLFRGKNNVVKNYELMIELIKAINKNLDKDPKTLFELGSSYIGNVEDAGLNVLTEIMNAFDPKKYSVLNRNPLSSLNHLGFKKFPISSKKSFTSSMYEAYNSIILDISNECDFNDLGKADHFLNYIYWKYAKNKAKKVKEKD